MNKYLNDFIIFLSSSSITDISTNGCKIGSPIVKFHTVGNTHLSCTGGQNHINCYEIGRQQENISIIDTMDSPTDICSDDNGHIYVSGQGSNNIHRLEDASKKLKDIPRKSGQVMNYRRFYVKPDWKVLDIPLDSRHGIQEPVALCFNHEYSKLYIVNDWGKSVLVFGVI
ncbi:unnamed protein product [Mytilus edulis]|uniref:Uncharacterized protein n=1 Tax=Mytilus edulis TaxID=6550 RepID=A0A8S3U141_MYTED|nr:unnamed protein product [Mytilus edulis]